MQAARQSLEVKSADKVPVDWRPASKRDAHCSQCNGGIGKAGMTRIARDDRRRETRQAAKDGSAWEFGK